MNRKRIASGRGGFPRHAAFLLPPTQTTPDFGKMHANRTLPSTQAPIPAELFLLFKELAVVVSLGRPRTSAVLYLSAFNVNHRRLMNTIPLRICPGS